VKLSKNFSLHEMEKSSTALRLGIVNDVPNKKTIEKLRFLCMNVLQLVRERFKKPVKVNSGYRCHALNKAIGGSRTSQHRKGEAADIEIAGVSNLKVAQWIRNNLVFDQLILEYHIDGVPESGWVHVSYKHGKNRMQVLSKIKGEKGYRKGLCMVQNAGG